MVYLTKSWLASLFLLDAYKLLLIKRVVFGSGIQADVGSRPNLPRCPVSSDENDGPAIQDAHTGSCRDYCFVLLKSLLDILFGSYNVHSSSIAEARAKSSGCALQGCDMHHM